MHDFSGYVGKSRRATDIVDPWRMQALAAALEEKVAVSRGDPMPLPFHFTLFPEVVQRSGTGSDGHPKRGGFMPPVSLPSRMFSGGRMHETKPLIIGEEVEKTERIKSITPKTGSSGQLVIVVVEYEYRQNGEIRLVEERDIIYREGGRLGVDQQKMTPVADAPWSEDWETDPVLLFRFSALTYNSHRIHYDLDYVMNDEKYPGLVVHGPLLATLLCRLAEKCSGRRPERFAFRAMRPMFSGWPLRLRGGLGEDGTASEVRAFTPSGDIAVEAHASFG